MSAAARARLAEVGTKPKPKPAEFSRWKGGVTSFGPVPRVIITVIVLAVAGWLIVIGNVDPAPAIVWCLIIAPLILRDLWRKARIR